jgi:hypothetical protein
MKISPLFAKAAALGRKVMKKRDIFKRASLAFAAVISFAALAAPRASAQDGASTQFRPTARDPFVKPRPAPPKPATPPKPAAPKQLEAPPIQARIENYKRLKIEAMNRQQPAPKPTTALLLSEVEVMGIFHTPRGYAAMVEAKPINLSYVIYPGEMFYDGQLVAIEDNRLLFRREVRWSNGKRDLVAEYKPLRPMDSAEDLALTKTSKAENAKDEKSKGVDKDAAAKDGDAKGSKSDADVREQNRKDETNRKAMSNPHYPTNTP